MIVVVARQDDPRTAEQTYCRRRDQQFLQGAPLRFVPINYAKTFCLRYGVVEAVFVTIS
jgi:hypothetical protein